MGLVPVVPLIYAGSSPQPGEGWGVCLGIPKTHFPLWVWMYQVPLCLWRAPFSARATVLAPETHRMLRLQRSPQWKCITHHLPQSIRQLQ